MRPNRFNTPKFETAAEAFEQGPLPEPKAPGRFSKVAKVLRGLLVQNNLLGQFQKNFTFALFLTLVALVYIWNSHRATQQAQHAERLNRELKELKTERMTLNAQLSTARQQSQLAGIVDSLGLQPLRRPPYKLKVAAPQSEETR